MKDVLGDLIEVELTDQENFLKVKETLTRIGVASRNRKRLTQSCHILHKRGRYYIVHFKQMFRLDGKPADIDDTDLSRLYEIVNLLESWGLIRIVSKMRSLGEKAVVTIIPFKDKTNWELVSKYTIGKKQ
jgi:hypothetical protein